MSRWTARACSLRSRGERRGEDGDGGQGDCSLCPVQGVQSHPCVQLAAGEGQHEEAVRHDGWVNVATAYYPQTMYIIDILPIVNILHTISRLRNFNHGRRTWKTGEGEEEYIEVAGKLVVCWSNE